MAHIRHCTPPPPPGAATTTSLSPGRGGGAWCEARDEAQVEEGVTECYYRGEAVLVIVVLRGGWCAAWRGAVVQLCWWQLCWVALVLAVPVIRVAGLATTVYTFPSLQ